MVKNAKLLPRPIYLSFDNELEGDAYVERLELLLARGVVPEAFARRQQELLTVKQAILAYRRSVALPESEQRLLNVLFERCGNSRLSDVDYAWGERWVEELKRAYKLAPSTVRHYVGTLARCLDWVVRKHPGSLPTNPLRMLPNRYASYSEMDVRVAGLARDDQERERRLQLSDSGNDEEARIRSILSGERPSGRQRALELKYQAALECLFDLALETAMRMREMYTVDLSQLDIEKRTIFLTRTKNGDTRQVPLSSVAVDVLERYSKHVEDGTRGMQGFGFERGLLFPWWDRDQQSLSKTTSRLSRQFARVFDAAGCVDLHFHDLRHEATCRFYERTTLTDIQVSRITGHKDLRMLKRYANLRGSDLANHLW